MIRGERAVRDERVDELEAGVGAERHRDRDRAVELDDRRRRALGEQRVERGDPRPLRRLGGRGARVMCGDSGLQLVRTGGGTSRRDELVRACKRREPAANEHAIPARAILIREQHRRAVASDASGEPRRREFEQRDQPVDFGLVGRKAGEHARDAEPRCGFFLREISRGYEVQQAPRVPAAREAPIGPSCWQGSCALSKLLS